MRQPVAHEVGTGPQRSAAIRDPLTAPAAAPVATWSATITAAFLPDVRPELTHYVHVGELAPRRYLSTRLTPETGGKPTPSTRIDPD